MSYMYANIRVPIYIFNNEVTLLSDEMTIELEPYDGDNCEVSPAIQDKICTELHNKHPLKKTSLHNTLRKMTSRLNSKGNFSRKHHIPTDIQK